MTSTEKRRHLHLDLEDTLIHPITANSWWQARPRQDTLMKVKAFIKEWQPHSVNIFSFAIWTPHELDGFNQGLRGHLEDELGVKFQAVPTVDDMIAVGKRVLQVNVLDMDDILHFIGKQDTFRFCMRGLETMAKAGPGIDVVLLDDVVYNESFDWPDMKISGRILNILDMKDQHGIDQP